VLPGSSMGFYNGVRSAYARWAMCLAKQMMHAALGKVCIQYLPAHRSVALAATCSANNFSLPCRASDRVADLP
jgi:hypothetical protein